MQLATGGAWIDPAGRGRRPLRLQCEGWADGLFAVAGFGRGGAGDQAGHVVDADVSGEHDGGPDRTGKRGVAGDTSSTRGQPAGTRMRRADTANKARPKP